MAHLHLIVGVVVLVTNLFAGCWGAYAWFAEKPSEGFWYALRVAQFVAMYYKNRYQRARPSQLWPELMPPIAVLPLMVMA